MFVQRPVDHLACDPEGRPVLDTFAEVQQQWHLWKRRYNLFLRYVRPWLLLAIALRIIH